jgi:hypothetical protein
MEDLPKEEGDLMLYGYPGVREKSGDEIKFSGEKKYTEDAQSYKAGDVFSEKGSLNTSTNTLLYESKTERAGSIIDRMVLEVVILKDGTYLLQYREFFQSEREGEPSNVNAVFKRFNKNEYSAITADMQGNADFIYDSIAGRGDMQAEAMAKDCNITGKFAVTGGNASFAK